MTQNIKDFEEFFLKQQEQKVGGVKRKQFSTNAEFNKLPPDPKKSMEVIENKIVRRRDFNPQPPEDVLQTIIKNQNRILENQRQIKERLEILEKGMKENVVDNSILMAQNHTTRECKVILEKLSRSMIRLTGEDENVLHVEIGATLPLSSIDAALDVEEKLEKPEYREAMKSYLFHLKGGKGTVDEVLRKTMKDELIFLFNFDGRKGKRALVKLTLINNILSGGRNFFEKELRKSIELSHNRYKQRKFVKK